MRVLMILTLLAAPKATPSPIATAEPPPPSSRTGAPSDKQIVAAVFENLETTFHADQGCDEPSGECTVGGFLQNTLAYLGEAEREEKKGGWARSRCELVAVSDGLRESIEPPRYSPKLAARLAKLGPRVWACELSFGHNPGTESVWSRELYFWLKDAPGHKVVQDSFQFNYTP